jgi:putative membrane protein
MRAALTVLIGLLVAAHLGFFAVEAVFWEHSEKIRKNLGFERHEPEEVHEVAKVATNQGLCNAFLAAGLAWGFRRYTRNVPESRAVLAFFLAFIVIAGVVGYVSINPPDPAAKAGFLVGQTGLALAALLVLRLSPHQ